MDEIEVPQYFVCPISLQIMKDPVTAVTGITYDRESIEHWLFKGNNTTCPVTNQPLPADSEYLTPNHTLRRLIQAWCTHNASLGIDRIPTPKVPLNKIHFHSLIRDLWHPNKHLKTLRKLEVLAFEHERNTRYMVEAGVIDAMLTLIIKFHTRCETMGLEEAMTILFLVRSTPWPESKVISGENDEIIDSLIWVLDQDFENGETLKSQTVVVLRTIIGKASSSVLERLKPTFFRKIVGVLKEGISHQGINAALQIMLQTTPCRRNRAMLIESEVVFHLIQLNLEVPEKRTTELSSGILFHLCSCADGRQKLLSHAAGLAILTKQLLNVSPMVDDRAMLIISLLCKFSGSSFLLKEMLSVGTVTKLCMVLQVECAPYLKDKAKELLRAHSHVWCDSPCVEVGTLVSKYCR